MLIPPHELDRWVAASATVASARVVINAHAGRVLAAGAEAFRDELARAFAAHGMAAEIVYARGPAIRTELRQTFRFPYMLPVIAGGDGTLMEVLDECIACGRPIGYLPLGTMNLLGRDLGLTGEIAHDVAIIARRHARTVTLGLVNGTSFHSNAGIGILGVMARERESARRRLPFSRPLSFAWAALRTLLFARPVVVAVDVEGERRTMRADAVLVTSNRFEGMPWRRPRLDGGMLEFHALRAPTILARLGMLLAVLRGRWREHPGLTTLETRSVRIERRDRRVSSVAIDGELRRIRGPIEISVAPDAIRIYGAKSEQDAA